MCQWNLCGPCRWPPLSLHRALPCMLAQDVRPVYIFMHKLIILAHLVRILFLCIYTDVHVSHLCSQKAQSHLHYPNVMPWPTSVNVIVIFDYKKKNPWVNSHLLLSLSYGAPLQVEAPTNSTLATKFKFHPAISSPLISLTTSGSGIRKRLHHKAHLIFWSSTLAVPHFVLNMAKRPQEMQVYTRRDVFAPPDASYINQVFQPEHGRERWCDDSQEASVIGCQRLLRTRPGWFFGAMQSASFPSFN